MAGDPAAEPLSEDFGLQLLLEAHHHAAHKPAAEHAAVLDALREVMMPSALTLPMADPRATAILSSGRLGGRKLLSAIRAADNVRLSLERDYRGFCRAAQHYLYHATVVESSPSPHERGDDVALALAVRFPWLVGTLTPSGPWESTAFSFTEYATA
ncbi:MAG TPA: hypothetical protein VLM79_29865 [Kofleriaceae bacterium]|nr:hypothetical protein [Kofleriaceae bacterium]